MAFIGNRLHRLIGQAKTMSEAYSLTNQLLQDIIHESIQYREPYASDIRNILVGLDVNRNDAAEITMRLEQALRVLNLTAHY